MKTDIEIAQEAVMQPIKEVAASYGIGEDDLELYGFIKERKRIRNRGFPNQDGRRDKLDPFCREGGNVQLLIGQADPVLHIITSPFLDAEGKIGIRGEV